jgi:mercuric ion binding protein
VFTPLSTAILALLAIAAPAAAAEQTATLAVENMTCAACPFIVKRTLAAVPGVREVTVSYEEHRAIVVYDVAAATVAMLTDATTQAGYPSRVVTP